MSKYSSISKSDSEVSIDVFESPGLTHTKNGLTHTNKKEAGFDPEKNSSRSYYGLIEEEEEAI